MIERCKLIVSGYLNIYFAKTLACSLFFDVNVIVSGEIITVLRRSFFSSLVDVECHTRATLPFS